MGSRRYEQRARAEATEQTRRAILDATQALFREDFLPDMSLERIAARAGCSSRTVLRQFGSKDGLIEATIADAESEVMRTREVEPGDVPAAISRLVDHYEETGDETARWLGAAERYPLVRRVTESGMRMHRTWAEQVFAPDLDTLARPARRRLLGVLASVTDLYMWVLLRRRHGLSRAATEASILDLVEAARAGA
jgi:AcrR family transcriptional regulator